MINENSNKIKGTVRVRKARKTKNGGKGRKSGVSSADAGQPIRNEKLKIKNEEAEKLGIVRPHPGPVASQARHELVAPQETCASRNVVPQEREMVSGASGGVERVENDSTDGLTGVAAAGPADTDALRGENAGGSRVRSPHQRISEPPDVGCYGDGGEGNRPHYVGGLVKNEEGNPPHHFGSYGKGEEEDVPARKKNEDEDDDEHEHDLETGRVKFRAYQKAVFNDHSSGIVVLHWSRQIGKSYVLAAWAVCRLLIRPGRLVTVLSNSRENGAEFLLKCAEICELNGTRFETVEVTHSSLEYEDMRMELRIRNGGRVGRIKVLAANPRTARGFSGDLILDEFAFHEDGQAIWEAAEPILASNKDFLCRVASTGNGRGNFFYRMVEGEEEIKNEKLKVENGEEGQVSSVQFSVGSKGQIQKRQRTPAVQDLAEIL
jgi:hypothetical protein